MSKTTLAESCCVFVFTGHYFIIILEGFKSEGRYSRIDHKMVKKPFFDPVEQKVNFPWLEKKLLDEWYKKGIVKKYLQKNKNSKKYFSFLDGPITANNPMGVHHVWGRTYKDLWQKFKNMQGYKERFQNGFDCQGLWVEVEVEKELGLKSKKDIENLVPGDKKASIAKFVELCKERVSRFANIQTEQTKRLGNFMDWDNSYYTLSDNNNYMIWHFLKKCHEKGLIYKGHDSVPWCPRCGTAISQHEMLTEDYKELTHETIYFELPIEDRKNEYLLVWTTTPWTLPANIAVAVDEDFDYSLVEGTTGDKFWVGKDLVEKVFKGNYKQIIKTVKGKELVGLKYRWAFDDLPRVKEVADKNKDKFHVVIPTDEKIMPISLDEGTGMVHTAVSAGEEDFALGKKLGLPMIEVIDEEANYIDGLGEFSGKNAKADPKVILDYLVNDEKKGNNWVFDITPITHRYPACWRCKTELVWRVVDEWYIAMDPLREPMKAVAKKINWLPKFGLKRELDWLKNMHDWLISKKRYWGLALPIWVCKSCGEFTVIGSKEELKEKAVSGWDKFEGHSPHRPWIDEVKVKCDKCGKEAQRISDVGNPWLDAGIVTYSTISKDNKSTPLYLSDKAQWKKWAPADFITESFPGQFKNWFYSLIAMSTVLENKEPFKTVLGFGTLLGEDGRPMHKSWGNAIEFNEGADKIGVDVMRWMYARQNPADNLLFGYKVADETRRRFHLKLWNVYNFFVTYANLDGWKPSKNSKTQKLENSKNVLDKWILVRLNQTIKETTDYLEKYDAYSASASIESFLDDVSLWYIRRSRDRVGPAAESKKGKSSFYQTIYHVLVTLSKVLEPFNPFISEEIYKNLTKEESVHLSEWPQEKRLSEEDTKILSEMNTIREVVEKAHAERKEAKIPVRQPLQSIKVVSPDAKPNDAILKVAMDELNVKKINWQKGEELSVKLDTTLTPELEEEAKARELIRKIQEERKRLGTNLTQKVNVTNDWLPSDKKLVQKIKTKTLAVSLKAGEFKVWRI